LLDRRLQNAATFCRTDSSPYHKDTRSGSEDRHLIPIARRHPSMTPFTRALDVRTEKGCLHYSGARVTSLLHRPQAPPSRSLQCARRSAAARVRNLLPRAVKPPAGGTSIAASDPALGIWNPAASSGSGKSQSACVPSPTASVSSFTGVHAR
jgi:hypothetical protein